MRTPCSLLAQLELSLIGGLSAGHGAGCDAFLVDIMGWTSACPLFFLMITSRTLFLLDIILVFFCLISGAETPPCETNRRTRAQTSPHNGYLRGEGDDWVRCLGKQGRNGYKRASGVFCVSSTA